MNCLNAAALAAVLAMSGCGDTSANEAGAEARSGGPAGQLGAPSVPGLPSADETLPSVPQQGTPSGGGGAGRGGAIVQATAGLPPGTVRMQKAEIIDAKGFAQPVVAGTVLIPAGWQTSGGVQWGALGRCGPDIGSDFQATSPDGMSSIRNLPLVGWNASRANFPMDPPRDGCERASYGSVRELLEAVALGLHPGGRIVDYRPLPEMVKPFEEMLASLQPMSDNTLQFRFWMEAGEVLVAYQVNGRDMREAISTMVSLTYTRMDDLMNPGQVALETISGGPTILTLVSAPNGALDLNLRKRVSSTVRYTPEWSEAVRKYQDEKHRLTMESMDEARRAQAARHQEHMKTLRHASEIRQGLYDDQQVANTIQAREFSEVIRGVETYHDPDLGYNVELDNTYEHAWRVKHDDTYILTNDAFFKPYEYGLEATELKVVEGVER